MEKSYWSATLNRRIRRRRALGMAGGAAAAAALLAACGGGDSGDGDGGGAGGIVSEPEDTTSQAKRGGIMKDRAFADPPTLDITTPNNPATPYTHDVYSGLVAFIPGKFKPSENEPGPDLAESWEYSPDGLQITLKIRQGVKWHNKPPLNGRALDVDDVVFAWNRFASKASGRVNVANSANPDAPIMSLTSTDSRTVVIKLKEPLVYALGLFHPSGASGVVMVPKETDSTFDARGDQIGTGPWVMTEYKPSIGYTFKRNPDYWDKDSALMEQIDMAIMPEYTAALTQLRAGNIYWLGPTTTTDIRPEDAIPLKREEPRISLYQGDLSQAGLVGRSLNFGWLPERQSPFLDERVRQAVSLSWDRDLYMDTFFNVSKFRDEGVPVDARWSSSLIATQEGWWLDPRAKDFGPNAKNFQHNLAEAKKLLAAAGHSNGFDMTSHYVTTTELGQTPNHAQVIDNFATELGLRIKQHSIDYLKEYVPNFRDGHGQYEGWAYVSTAGGATGGHAVGSMASEFWSKGGAAFKGFSTTGRNDQAGDPQVDSIIEKARVERDSEKGKALIYDLQRYLGQKMYNLSLPGYATGLTVAWPAVGNFRVWRGARTHYRFWIDDTKPPFRPA
jgi:peptide/nickel transport system substrate-binding protein